MNTKVYTVLKPLLDFFRMAKEIFKYKKGVHVGVKGSFILLLRRKITTLNKKSSKREMERANSWASDFCSLLG